VSASGLFFLVCIDQIKLIDVNLLNFSSEDKIKCGSKYEHRLQKIDSRSYSTSFCDVLYFYII